LVLDDKSGLTELDVI